jgi:hypothetical protein
MNKDDGGYAFPMPMGSVPVSNVDRWHHAQFGMSLRDYFAAAAIPAVFSDPFYREKLASPYYLEISGEAAEKCYAVADAMLKERAK